MKLKLILITLVTISLNTPILSQEIDCNKFDKLSTKYIECTAKKLKEKASDEIVKSKKKMNETGLGEKIKKFKDSKTLSDLIKG
tara:strand:+ start:911 stop:1162 length:252 start_codon:yes stop_codon:yes gene_type:complete